MIQGKSSWFFLHKPSRSRYRKQSTETNDLRLQTSFLTQETERQTLPFGKWFLDRKKKKMKTETNNQTSTPGIEFATSRSVFKRSPHCATYASGICREKFSYIIRYSRLKCSKAPFFSSSVAHSHFDYLCRLSWWYLHSTIHFQDRIPLVRPRVDNRPYHYTRRNTQFYNIHQTVSCKNLEQPFHEMVLRCLGT